MKTIDMDYYIAEQKLKLVKTTGFGSSFVTIWKGSFIHVFWNNLSHEIVQIWPGDVVEEGDLGTLNFILENYFKINVRKPLTNR